MPADRSTKKQQELLQFIDGFTKGNDYSPTYREVMRALGYKSVSTVAVHVDNLIAKGYLRKKDNSARSLEVVRMVAPKTVDAELSQKAIGWLVGGIEDRLKVFQKAYSRESYEELQTLVAALKILATEEIAEVQIAALEAAYNKHKQ